MLSFRCAQWSIHGKKNCCESLLVLGTGYSAIIGLPTQMRREVSNDACWRRLGTSEHVCRASTPQHMHLKVIFSVVATGDTCACVCDNVNMIDKTDKGALCLQTVSSVLSSRLSSYFPAGVMQAPAAAVVLYISDKHAACGIHSSATRTNHSLQQSSVTLQRQLYLSLRLCANETTNKLAKIFR